MTGYVKVLESLRFCNGSYYRDCEYFGALFLYDSKGLKQISGNITDTPLFLRSLFKPIQATILADYDVINTFNFTDYELAVMQSSHAGEKVHTDIVYSILNKIGLNEDDLMCPIINPLNPEVTKNALKISKIHNNCSGKHAMMLSVCKKMGYDIKTYLDKNHPVQKAILKKLIELSGYKNPLYTLDGCNAPVYGLPVANIAQAFLNLYSDKRYDLLKNAYINNCYIIGGVDSYGLRNDSFIMKHFPFLISKTGAGGFLTVYNQNSLELLIIKMAQDNNDMRLRVALDAIYKLGWSDKNLNDDNLYTESLNVVGKYKAYTF